MACSGIVWVFSDIDESHILAKNLLNDISSCNKEYKRHRNRTSKAHLMVSRIISLHGITGKTHQALSDAFCPTVCPRCTTFFCGPEMLTACLGDLSTLCRYGRKVQSLEDRWQAQKAFVLLLARCKGWAWLESSSSSHTAWAEREQVGCTWHRGVLCSLQVAASCWASQFSSGCFLLQHSCWMN